MPGMGELLIILLIVMVVFGASKLPQIGHGLGSAIKNFKRAAAGEDEIEVSRKETRRKQIRGKAAKELAAARDEDDEDELDDEDEDEVEEVEVVPRRKAKKPA